MVQSLKVLIVGETYVGKTAIFNRIQQGEFYEEGTATLAATFAMARVEIPESESFALEGKAINTSQCKVQLWDTPGD